MHRHLFNVALCSFGLSCCLSREESQVKAVWDEMATSQYVGDERSLYTVFRCTEKAFYML